MKDQTDLQDAGPAAVMAPRQMRSRQSLARVLIAAREVLAQRGIDDFTMAAVADRAGLAAGGIYRRFESKDALLRKVKDDVFAELEAALDERLATPCPHLTEVVAVFVNTLANELSSSNQLYPSLLAASAGDDVMSDRGTEWQDRTYDFFRAAALQHRNEIGHDDAETALRVAYQIMTGVLLRRASVRRQVAVPSQVSWRALAEQVNSATVRYLVARE
jgi:AcrR family transcriptional regulator